MIINKDKKVVVANKQKVLTNIISKAIGLMFHPKIKDEGYIFSFKEVIKVTIHMLFVFQTIDVVFLDENKKVIELKKDLKPFTLYTAKNKSKYFIEFPKDTIIEKNINIDDIITF